MQNAHMRVQKIQKIQKVQKVQRVQRVVVAAPPQILKGGAAGAASCIEGLHPTGKTTNYILCVAPLLQNVFAVHRFVQGAMSIKNATRENRTAGSRQACSLFSIFLQSLIQRFPAAAQCFEERYHVGEFLSFGQGIVLVQGQVMALCVQNSHVVGKAVGKLVL